MRSFFSCKAKKLNECQPQGVYRGGGVVVGLRVRGLAGENEGRGG